MPQGRGVAGIGPHLPERSLVVRGSTNLLLNHEILWLLEERKSAIPIPGKELGKSRLKLAWRWGLPVPHTLLCSSTDLCLGPDTHIRRANVYLDKLGGKEAPLLESLLRRKVSRGRLNTKALTQMAAAYFIDAAVFGMILKELLQPLRYCSSARTPRSTVTQMQLAERV